MGPRRRGTPRRPEPGHDDELVTARARRARGRRREAAHLAARTMAGEWVSSCRGVDGDEEERRRRLSEQRKKTAASGGRCGDSGLQRVAPDEGEDDGGPWRHRGAVRWARWPWLGRSHGVGGVRMQGERGGRGAVDLEGRRKYLWGGRESDEAERGPWRPYPPPSPASGSGGDRAL